MNWEIQLLQLLQEMRNPFLNALMEAISFIAEHFFIVGIIATLYWCVDKVKVMRFAWLILVNGITNGIIKNLIKAPRPFQKGITKPLRIETATSYAFPSGHVQTATAFWLGAAKLFKSKSMAIMGSIIIVLTALSRMYLGVHWPVDVIGGVVVGIITLLVADQFYDETKGFTRWHVIGVGILALIFLFIPIESNLASTIGALWGLVVGGYIEQTAIHFDVQGDWKYQLKKLIIGIAGTLLLYMGYTTLFGSDPVLDMIKYAVVMLWIVAGAPYTFKYLKKYKR